MGTVECEQLTDKPSFKHRRNRMKDDSNENKSDSQVEINEITDRAHWEDLKQRHGNGQLDWLSSYDNLDHEAYADDHVIDRGENQIPGTDDYQKSDTGYMRSGGSNYVNTITGLPR